MLTIWSLYTNFVSWREVDAGRAHIDVIRDLTGRIDRDTISGFFGPPDEALCYPVNPQIIHKAKAPCACLLSNELVDACLIILLGLALFEGASPVGLTILWLSAGWIIAGYVLAIYLILTHKEHIEVEL